MSETSKVVWTFAGVLILVVLGLIITLEGVEVFFGS